MEGIDSVHLAFDPTGLFALNIILALIMFGVALELKFSDFRRVFQQPRAVLTGLTAQLLVLPAATFLLTLAVDLPASVELGMMLVAACPGGNVSNFMTALARGNVSLSITMTAIVTTLAVVSTPANIAIWGALNPNTAPILNQVQIHALEMAGGVALIIGLPVAIGMWLHARQPALAARLVRPFKIGSIAALALFIAVALGNNVGPALTYIPQIMLVVVAHNALGLAIGRTMGELARLPEADKRTLTIEVGIQNSGLGLVLIFSFFGGMGGMAVVAAFWGMWHLVSGIALARFWNAAAPSAVESAEAAG